MSAATYVHDDGDARFFCLSPYRVEPMWLGEWPFGTADATSKAFAPALIASPAKARRALELHQRHIAGRQQPPV